MAASPLLRNNAMTCTLRVLGCSGGIGADLRTTSFLLNEDILIDAGTGVGDLTLDELRKINHVFVTHSHLDHICCLPLMSDAVGASRLARKDYSPLKVYGIPETLKAIKDHIFNNVIWPDFTKLPSAEKPFISLHSIELGQAIEMNGVSITALPVDHSIPAVAYALQSAQGTLVFSGDTGTSAQFIAALNTLTDLHHLIIETSFNDSEEALAKISGHLAPTLLTEELRALQHPDLQIWISHLKPDGGHSIYAEIAEAPFVKENFKHHIHHLQRGEVIQF